MFAVRRFAHLLFAASLIAGVVAPSHATAASPGDDTPGFAAVTRHLANAGGEESITDVVVQPDGKIVAAVLDDTEVDRRIVRLNADGSLDATFADGGSWHAPSTSTTTVRALAIAPDGKIVFGGEDTGRPAIVLGRLTADGVLDPSFSGDGYHVSVAPTGSAPIVHEVIVEPDGKVVFAGIINIPPKADELYIGRLLANGNDDPGFNGDPITNFGSSINGEDDVFAGLVRMPNGVFVMGDDRMLSNAMVWRISSNGASLIVANVALPTDLDTPMDVVATDATHAALLLTGNHGASGIAYMDVSQTPTVVGPGDGVVRPFPASFTPQSLLREPGGRYVVAGVDSTGGLHRAIARVNANGTIDASFGSGGLRHLPGATNEAFYLERHETALAPDGAIVSGWHVLSSPASSAVAKLVGRIARVRTEVIAPAGPGLVEQRTTFTVRVHNDGPDSAGSGTVSFTMGAGLRVSSVTGVGCTANPDGGRCRVDGIEPGSSRDVQVQVRASAAGTRTMSATSSTSTFDDQPGDDAATGSLAFAAPAPTAAAAAAPAPAPAQSTSARQRLVLTLHRIRGYRGRVLRGCGSARVPCRMSRVRSRGRMAHAFVRIGVTPAPQGRRMTRLLMQKKVGRRWRTQYLPRVPVTRFGRTEVRMPRQWRTRPGQWRVRVQTVVPRGKRPARSWFIHYVVR